MSSKKRAQKSVIIRKEPKFIDNTVILDYTSENQIMSQSLEPIKKILQDEKCKEKGIKFTNELALDLDNVEIEMKKGTSSDESNTVDFVVGLENKHLLLVEAKFEAKNMNNIASEIPKKIKHSKEILISNTKFTNIYSKIIILLNSDNFQQNKRKLLNLLDNKISYSPMKVNEFYNTFFER